MPLIPFPTLLDKAIKGKYAVGYFEAWDQYSLEAVLEAAEECHSPVIIGFGGVQMEQGWFTDKGLEELAALGKVAAERAKVEVSYILNEVKEFRHVAMGIGYGFNVVMMDTSRMPLKENIAITKRIVEMAHKNKVAVEGELGRLPEGDEIPNKNFLTDPDEAEYFVRETGVDALSVAIGNVHALSKGRLKIDFKRLKEIKDKVKVPLVIHGGTGFPKEAIPKCIQSGVVKFNVGTILKKVFLDGVKKSIDRLPRNKEVEIQYIIGSRKVGDILTRAKENVKREVTNFLKLYNCYQTCPTKNSVNQNKAN